MTPRLALLLLLLLAAPGCLYIGARGRVGPRLDPALAARIEPGVTTRTEVLELLGPPDEFLTAEETALLLDDAARLSEALDVARRAERAFTWQIDHFELDGTFLLLYTYFDIETEPELLVIWFDDDGRVAHLATALRRSAG